MRAVDVRSGVKSTQRSVADVADVSARDGTSHSLHARNQRQFICPMLQQRARLHQYSFDQLGSTPGLALSGNNLGQVVHTRVPLSTSGIIWYRSNGGDALRLGR